MDKRLFFVLLFMAATGFATGVFFEINLSGTGKDQLMELLSEYFSAGNSISDAEGSGFTDSFLQNMKGGLLFWLVCFLSPVLLILLPVMILFLFLRGLFLGFSAAMVMETFGLSGTEYLLAVIVPSGLLQVFLFAFLMTISLHEGMAVIQVHFPARIRLHFRSLRTSSIKNRKALLFTAGPYLNFYMAGLAVLTLSCLLQAFLLQAVT